MPGNGLHFLHIWNNVILTKTLWNEIRASVICMLQIEIWGTEEESSSTRSPNKEVTNLKLNPGSLAPQPEFLPIAL